MADRIPGTSSRRKRGPRERSLGALGTRLRALGLWDEWTATIYESARALAIKIDALDRQPGEGGHTLAMLSKAYREHLHDIRPPLPELETADDADPYDAALAELLGT